VATCNIGQTVARLVEELDLPRGALAADLGCGDGQRGARVLSELGFSVYGCELDPAKARLAEAFGTIDLCDVRQWRPPREPLDLVICAELLEHLPLEDQGSLLRRTRGWLRSGGALILSTPQRNSPVALLERAYARLRRQGPYDWWDPTHASVLRRKHLEQLFADSGFIVKRRVGSHIVPELLRLPALHWTVHEGPLSVLGFDLVYVLA
jgi:2-polyprenyl-3-methyl-5-hydroxy-6-metoxy-1,4-benzoquinol methylase